MDAWGAFLAATDVTLDLTSSLLGPVGALAFALTVVGILWREDRHNRIARIEDLKATILDLKTDRDTRLGELRAERDLNLAGWRVQTDANAKLAEAWEARNRADGERRRGTDTG